MAKKFIVTHEVSGVAFSNAFLISDGYDKSLAGYQTLFTEAKESFPNITPADVECGVVVNSGWCKGSAFMRVQVSTGVEVEGWESCNGRLPAVALS